MATPPLRNLPPDVSARLAERAKQHRRSISEEAAFIIEQAIGKPEARQEIWRQVGPRREFMRSGCRSLPLLPTLSGSA